MNLAERHLNPELAEDAEEIRGVLLMFFLGV